VCRCVYGTEASGSTQGAEFFVTLRIWQLLKMDCAARRLLKRQDSRDSDASQEGLRWPRLVIQ
jgi:hypothetical protein